MKRLGAWLVEGVLPPLVFFAIVAGVWQAATSLWNVPAYLVPGPERVLASAREHETELLSAMRLTGGAALLGFTLSLLVGTGMGLIFSQSRIIQRSMYPYAIFLQTVPIVAIAPVLIMWFGNGFGGVVAVSFILSVFPIITNATTGLTSVDPNLLELFEIYNASRLQSLLKLRLPNAVPFLVAAAKISCGLSVIGAIVGELFAGFEGDNAGLGTLLARANGRLDTSYVFAAVFCSTILSIAIFAAVSSIGATILARWHIGASRGSTTNA